MEIIFMIFGRLYATQIVVLLLSFFVNLFISLFFWSIDSKSEALFAENSNSRKKWIICSLSVFLHVIMLLSTTFFFLDLQVLHGVKFGPIVDMAAPDAIVKTSLFSLNILPVVFFVVSLVSVTLSKEKKNDYKIFLMVLYFCISIVLYFSSSANGIF